MKMSLYVLAFICLQLACRAQVSTPNPDYETPQLEVEIDEPLYDYVEVQDCIPEAEAVLQADGTYVYEVSSCNSDYDTPQLEAPIEEPLYDYVEIQDCIPEAEAVLQDDGSYVYEEVKSCPSTDNDRVEPTEDPQSEVEEEDYSSNSKPQRKGNLRIQQ